MTQTDVENRSVFCKKVQYMGPDGGLEEITVTGKDELWVSVQYNTIHQKREKGGHVYITSQFIIAYAD